MIDKNNNELCGDNTIHRDRIERAKAEMPDDETLYDLAELFKIFGDTTRVKILCALFTNEMCVCDMAALLGVHPVGRLAPAQNAQAGAAGQIQKGRQGRVLFARRRPR